MSDLAIITKLETLTPELKDEVNNFIDLLIEKSVRTCHAMSLNFKQKAIVFVFFPSHLYT